MYITIYKDIILVAFNEKNADRDQDIVDMTGLLGVTRQELLNKHYKIYGRMMNALALRQQILPMLSQAGLITEEQDPNDKRAKLIFPNTPNNSELDSGVKNNGNNDISKKITDIFGDGEILNEEL